MAKRPPSNTRTFKNSGFAGEMLVAAELSRLGYEVLLGNIGTKRTVGVDLAAVDPATARTTSISVKSLKHANSFLIDPEKVHAAAVYVFVITNAAGQQPQFFVAQGSQLLANEVALWDKYGRDYPQAGRRGIRSGALVRWLNNWPVIDK